MHSLKPLVLYKDNNYLLALGLSTFSRTRVKDRTSHDLCPLLFRLGVSTVLQTLVHQHKTSSTEMFSCSEVTRTNTRPSVTTRANYYLMRRALCVSVPSELLGIGWFPLNVLINRVYSSGTGIWGCRSRSSPTLNRQCHSQMRIPSFKKFRASEETKVNESILTTCISPITGVYTRFVFVEIRLAVWVGCF